MNQGYGVAADWPIDDTMLEPYYLEAERIMGVAGPGSDTRRWRSKPHPLPAHELSYASQRLRTGCASLSLNMSANSLAALSRPYDGRPGCNYCGHCTRGCPHQDKGSADVTFTKQALSEWSFNPVAHACPVTRNTSIFIAFT
jgi:choline dehydrogenase-like flavoprotein